MVAVGFAVTLAAALWLRSPSAIRVTLVTAVIAAIYRVWITFDLPPAPATVAVCVVLLVAWPVFRRVPALRPTGTWLTAGRFSGDVVWLLVALIVGSAVALTVWVQLNDPAPPPFQAELADNPWLLVAGMIGFSLVNGFPSGWIGAVLSGGWGLPLGVLRARSGGMVAPYVHTCARTRPSPCWRSRYCCDRASAATRAPSVRTSMVAISRSRTPSSAVTTESAVAPIPRSTTRWA